MQYRQSLFVFFFIFVALTQVLHAHEKFVVFTPPKCGTHLIGKAMGLITGKKPTYYLTELGDFQNAMNLIEQTTENHSFAVAHNFSAPVLKTLTQRGYKVIFILRDPRDQLISMLNWFKEGQWSWMRVAHIPDQNVQITELITGRQFGWRCYDGCIGLRLACLKHLDEKDVLITYFENLVGPAGGGSEKKQVREIKKLARFIGTELPTEQVQAIASSIFGGTWSFRRGEIGVWKEYFTPTQRTLYKGKYGKKLIEHGYESGYKWDKRVESKKESYQEGEAGQKD